MGSRCREAGGKAGRKSLCKPRRWGIRCGRREQVELQQEEPSTGFLLLLCHEVCVQGRQGLGRRGDSHHYWIHDVTYYYHQKLQHLPRGSSRIFWMRTLHFYLEEYKFFLHYPALLRG